MDDLVKDAERLRELNEKVSQALRIRVELVRRIKNSCELLSKNPNDESVRSSLVNTLKKERSFLDIIRKGAKEGSKILEDSLKRVKHMNFPDDDKNNIKEITENLLDVMRFTQKNIKVIEKRLKKGEKLEKKEYTPKRLAEFYQIMDEESELDKELNERLRGKFNRIMSPTKALAQKMGVGAAFGAVFSAGVGSAMVMSNTFPIREGMEKTREFSSVEIMAVVVLIYAIAFVFGFLKAEGDIYQEEQSIQRYGV